jgi:hypothetical protein
VLLKKEPFMKLFLLLFLYSSLLFAQAYSDDPSRIDPNVMRASGNIVSLRLVLGEPIKLFVVGREEAKLDLSQLSLTVRRLSPYPGTNLKLNRLGDYFVLADSPELNQTTNIEVTAQVKNKIEKFQFKIKNKMQ